MKKRRKKEVLRKDGSMKEGEGKRVEEKGGNEESKDK